MTLFSSNFVTPTLPRLSRVEGHIASFSRVNIRRRASFHKMEQTDHADSTPRRLLNATNFDLLGLEVISSSHLEYLSRGDCPGSLGSPNNSYKLGKAIMRAGTLPTNTEVNAFGGLLLADKIYRPDPANLKPIQYFMDPARQKQRDYIQEISTILRDTNRKVALFQTGSNDYKSFVVRDGKFITLQPYQNFTIAQALSKQSVRMSGHLEPAPTHPTIISDSDLSYVKNQVRAYLAVLTKLISDSEVQYIFHSSILERFYTNTSGWLCIIPYFNIINFCLRDCLAELNSPDMRVRILNRNGYPTTWHFSDVAEQIQTLLDDGVTVRHIFNPSPQGRLIHRKISAMSQIVRIHLYNIYKTLAESGAITPGKEFGYQFLDISQAYSCARCRDTRCSQAQCMST